MTRRLAIAIALYIERFHTWPLELRLSASAPYYVVLGMGPEDYEALAARLKMRPTKHADIPVGGEAGHVTCAQEFHPRADTLQAVEREPGLASTLDQDRPLAAR